MTYKTITDQLPSKKFVQILGDFNVNLFKTNETMTSQFEEHFLSEGLYPTISIQTHKRDFTKGSCIDNIYTTSIENIQYSGTIQGFGKHHSLIFTTSNLNMEQKVTCEKQKISYDISNLKMDKFLVDLTEMSKESMGINVPSQPKLTKPSNLKFPNLQNVLTEIIQRVLNKAKLYVDWKRTCSEKLVNGNQELYNKYSTFASQPVSQLKNPNRSFADYLGNRVCSSMFLQQCSSEEISNIINEFENEKASDISARVLKRVKDQISGHISGFINSFMKLETFPKSAAVH